MEFLLPVLIALVVSVLAPAVSDWLKGRREHGQREQEAQLRADEKKQDWARQDEVSQALIDAAEKAATKTEEAARLLLASNDRVAATAHHASAERANIDAKLDGLVEGNALIVAGNAEIHTLVNSNLTAAREDTVTAYELVLALLEKEHARDPSDATQEAVDAIKRTLDALRTDVSDRIEQTAAAAAQKAEDLA